MEQIANAVSTTVTNDVTAAATSITVADGSVLPATTSGNFRLKWESELVICTARSGNALTLTRGIEGTTATAHSSGTRLTVVATAGGINQVISEFAPSVATASVATAGTVSTDADRFQISDVTATGSFTLANPTNSTNGHRYEWRVWNNSVSDILITPGANFRLNTGTDATTLWTVPAGKTNRYFAEYTTLGGVTKWDIIACIIGS